MKTISEQFSKILLASLLIVGMSCEEDTSRKWNCEQNSAAFTVTYNDNKQYDVVVENPINGKLYGGFWVVAFREGGKNGENNAYVTESPTEFGYIIKWFYPATAYRVRAFDFYQNIIGTDCWEKTITTPCAPFNYLRAESVTSSTARVAWHWASDNFSAFKAFTVSLRKKGEVEVTTFNTSNHFLEVTGLSPNTEYQTQMVYTCTDNIEYPSEWWTFKTLE